MPAPAIANEKYISLTTYTKAGDAKKGPVWIADLGDGTVGFTTASSSWKIKRLRNDSRVEIQPSDSKGRVTDGSEPLTGKAQIVSGAEFAAVRATLKGKYKIQYTMIELAGKVAKLIGKGSGTDTGVIITLD